MTSPLGRVVPTVLLLAMPAMTPAGTAFPPQLRSVPLEQRELQISRHVIRSTQFVAVPLFIRRSGCEKVQPPQPLTTPDPLLAPSNQDGKVKVSFIIGADGRVHSPLILQSAGLAGDRHVLETVRTWKFRPATCNGVPTETEGKIEFSAR